MPPAPLLLFAADLETQDHLIALPINSTTPMRWTPAEAPVPSDAQTSSTSTWHSIWIDQLYGVSCPPGGTACTRASAPPGTPADAPAFAFAPWGALALN